MTVEEQEGANNDMSVLTVGRNGWWIRFQRTERLEKNQIGGGVGGGIMLRVCVGTQHDQIFWRSGCGRGE